MAQGYGFKSNISILTSNISTFTLFFHTYDLHLLFVYLFILLSFQVRDYIHVIDLADGHIAAVKKLADPSVGMLLFSDWRNLIKYLD